MERGEKEINQRQEAELAKSYEGFSADTFSRMSMIYKIKTYEVTSLVPDKMGKWKETVGSSYYSKEVTTDRDAGASRLYPHPFYRKENDMVPSILATNAKSL